MIDDQSSTNTQCGKVKKTSEQKYSDVLGDLNETASCKSRVALEPVQIFANLNPVMRLRSDAGKVPVSWLLDTSLHRTEVSLGGNFQWFCSNDTCPRKYFLECQVVTCVQTYRVCKDGMSATQGGRKPEKALLERFLRMNPTVPSR